MQADYKEIGDGNTTTQVEREILPKLKLTGFICAFFLLFVALFSVTYEVKRDVTTMKGLGVSQWQKESLESELFEPRSMQKSDSSIDVNGKLFMIRNARFGVRIDIVFKIFNHWDVHLYSWHDRRVGDSSYWRFKRVPGSRNKYYICNHLDETWCLVAKDWPDGLGDRYPDQEWRVDPHPTVKSMVALYSFTRNQHLVVHDFRDFNTGLPFYEFRWTSFLTKSQGHQYWHLVEKK